MLRHAGTLYSMIEACEITRSEVVENGISRSLDFLLTEAITGDEENQFAYVVDKTNHNEVKFGACAVTLLALAKLLKSL